MSGEKGKHSDIKNGQVAEVSMECDSPLSKPNLEFPVAPKGILKTSTNNLVAKPETHTKSATFDEQNVLET